MTELQINLFFSTISMYYNAFSLERCTDRHKVWSPSHRRPRLANGTKLSPILYFEPWRLCCHKLFIFWSWLWSKGCLFWGRFLGAYVHPLRARFPLLWLFCGPEKPKLASNPFEFDAIFCQLLFDIYSEFFCFYIQHDVDYRKRVGSKRIYLSWPNQNGPDGGFYFWLQFCDLLQI